MADTEVGGLVVKMKADLSDYMQKLDQMEKQTTTTSSKVTSAFMGISSIMAKAGIVMGGFATTAINSAMKWGNAVDDLSDKTGMAGEESSKLLVIAKRVGIGAEEASMMFSRFARSAYTAADAQATATAAGKQSDDAYSRLGISILNADNTMKSASEIFGEVKDKISELPDGIQKTALEMELFGRSGADMHDMLNMTTQEMQKVIEKAQAMGLILSSEQAAAWEKFERDVNSTKGTLTSLGISIGNELMPQLKNLLSDVQRVTQAFTSLDPETRQNILSVVKIGAEIGITSVAINKAIGVIGGVTEGLGLMRLATLSAAGPWVSLAAAIGIAINALDNYAEAQYKVQGYNNAAEVRKFSSGVEGIPDTYQVKRRKYVYGIPVESWENMTPAEREEQVAFENRPKPEKTEVDNTPPPADTYLGGGGAGDSNTKDQKTALQAYTEEMQKLISLWEKEVELGELSKTEFQGLLQERLDGLNEIEAGDDEVLDKQQAQYELLTQIRQAGEQARQEIIESAQQQFQLGNITNQQLADTLTKQYNLAESEKERVKILLQLKNVYEQLKNAADEYYKAAMQSAEDEAQKGNKELEKAKKAGSDSANLDLKKIAAQYGNNDLSDQLRAVNATLQHDTDTFNKYLRGEVSLTAEQAEELYARMQALSQAQTELINQETVNQINAARQNREAWVNNLADIITNTRSAHDILKQQWRDFVAQILAEQLKISMASNVFGAIFGVKVSGARAGGGDVQQGQTYLVGEKGPELFTAPYTGSIIPNSDITSGKLVQQSNGQTVQYNVSVPVTQNFTGQQDASVVAQIKASMPYIKNEIRNAIQNETAMRNTVRGAAG